jgi:predicted transcriptional regulator
MYAAFLSYSQVKEYLAFLQSKELLMYEEGTSLYKLTEKGLQCLGTFEELNEIMSLSDVKPLEQTPIIG